MAHRDPMEGRGSEDEPVVAPNRGRREPLHFPRHDRGPTINLWRTSLYFVALVIVLAVIAYLIVRPR